MSFNRNSMLAKKNVGMTMNQSIVVKRVDYLGVSKNKGTPKWMVYNGKPN